MTREEIIDGMGWSRIADLSLSDMLERIERLVAAAEAREREACAQIIDANASACANNSMLQDALRGNAAAIRARGEKP